MGDELFHRVGDVRIEHQVYNPSYLRARPPIVFFHGTPGSCKSAEVWCEEFIKLKYPVFAFTRGGYKQSTLGDGYRTFADQAKRMREVLDDYGVDYAVVYGVSGGAACALDFCKLYPTVVVGLILESAVLSHYKESRGSLYQRVADKVLYTSFGQWLYATALLYIPTVAYYIMLVRYSTMTLRRLGFEVKVIQYDNTIKDRAYMLINDLMSDKPRPIGYENDLNELLTDRTGHLAFIPKNTLVLHGTADSETPISDTDRVGMVQGYSNVHAVVDGSHVLPLSSRHQYVSDLKIRFLHRILNYIDHE